MEGTRAPRLELWFERDDDGTGELFVIVARDRFSGAASAFLSCTALEAFGRGIRDTFPMAPGTVISLLGGVWKHPSDPPELEEVLAGIRVYPVGTLGQVGIHVELLEPPYNGQRAESRSSLRVELTSEPESIRVFGGHVMGLADGLIGCARLDAA